MGMESGGRLCMKAVLLALALLTLIFLLAIGYLCPQSVCSAGKLGLAGRGSRDSMGGPLSFLSQPLRSDRRNKLSFDDMLGDDFEFDMKGSDVMVFLHIQKTGGTVFGRHLVHDLDLEKPCECQRGRKRCRCNRPNSSGKWWLFSRYSTGWKCGLHADWTELTACVDSAMDRTEKTTAKRRYFYVTLLREPVARFLSEFRHVQRGATWRGSRHWCGGRGPTREELPPCFNGTDWRDVTFQKHEHPTPAYGGQRTADRHGQPLRSFAPKKLSEDAISSAGPISAPGSVDQIRNGAHDPNGVAPPTDPQWNMTTAPGSADAFPSFNCPGIPFPRPPRSFRRRFRNRGNTCSTHERQEWLRSF
ncbi:hypothetical protein HPB47_026485 [Ixodes persulcatus]|uniref:Uncharacterized protein n=1 Tax=Ixodes persulcatus TaxID=34615 RepID=A0AC60PZ02_IXOPE|nr:hypothetical protein HPB47_026485 [Ixodes persulcatus]